MKSMASKLFLDTNILIDYTLRRKFELEATDALFELAEDKKLDLFVSESVITTAFYFLQKEKINGLAIFRELSSCINIASFKKDILFSPLENFKEAEDGLLYFTAAKANLNFFITRNIKHFKFQLPSLPAMTPTQFLNFYNSGNDLS
jgi:predicted nucleic acid-binding protein